MKLEQLQKIFENATEEQLSQINNFYQKDKDLIKSLQEENNSLTTRNTELTQNIKELEKNKGNAEELQKNIEDLQNKLKEQEEIYTKEAEERQLNDVVADVFADKKFVNDITKQGYANKLKEAILDPTNKGKSAKELFDAMTKDVENIFVNEQQEKITIPAVGNTGSGISFTEKQIESMSIDDINANWENIKKGVIK
ncbi:phage scaffolding protein [[Clostridium] colinum]|uniref:phage scaffolding protein n=1 Tax=[Clostridium] colinum TaxID=36835 RepID=UPI002025206D|nr:phage scaffolding protein [[Clostridium] colinum]